MFKKFRKTLSLFLCFLIFAGMFNISVEAAQHDYTVSVYLDGQGDGYAAPEGMQFDLKVVSDNGSGGFTVGTTLNTLSTDNAGKLTFTVEDYYGETNQVDHIGLFPKSNKHVPGTITGEDYWKDDIKAFVFAIRAPGKAPLIRLDTAKASIQVKKISGISGNAIPRMSFGLFDNVDCTGTPVATATSDGNGIAKFDNIEVGNYWIKETSQDAHYVENNTVVPVQVTAADNGTTIDKGNFENFEKFSIKFKKFDGLTNTPLAGRKFELKDGNDNHRVIATATSNDAGEVIFENIEYTPNLVLKEVVEGNEYAELEGKVLIGDFAAGTANAKALIEQIVNNNYVLDSSLVSVTNVKYLPDFANFAIKLNKFDNSDVNKTPIAGATFKIYHAKMASPNTPETDSEGNYIIDDTKPVATVTTNNEGTAKIPFRFVQDNPDENGYYLIQEESAPRYYETDNTLHLVQWTGEPNSDVPLTGKLILKDVGRNVSFDASTATIHFGNDEKDFKFNLIVNKVKKGANTVLPDATFVLTGINGTTYNAVTKQTTAVANTVEFTNLIPGSYSLTETVPPVGYMKLTTPINFTIDKDGVITWDTGTQPSFVKNVTAGTLANPATDLKFDVENEPIEVSFRKVDEDGNVIPKNMLVPAEFTISQCDDDRGTNPKLIASWSTQNYNPFVLDTSTLVYGKYLQIKEVTSPHGANWNEDYELMSDRYFLIDETLPKSIDLINFISQTTPIVFSKQSVTNTKELPGARLTLYKIVKGEELLVETWTSTTTQKTIEIPTGDYKLVEIQQPDGYVLNEEAVEFSVEEKSGNYVIVDKDGNEVSSANPIVMYNTPKKVRIRKVDSLLDATLDSSLVAGATFKITDGKNDINVAGHITNADGSMITVNPSDFTFSAQDFIISGLFKVDTTYYIVETKAPRGYEALTEPVAFTVNADETQTVVVKNVKQWQIPISKVDITTSKELPGAELKLYKGKTDSDVKDSNLVESWTSTDKPHTLWLSPGNYALVEIAAPNSYARNKETVFFEVKADGTTTPEHIKMENEPRRVTIDKVDKATQKRLKGAELKLERKTDSGWVQDDPSWTWTTDGETAKEFKNIIPGQYRINETKVPDGYKKLSELNFTVKNTDTHQNWIVTNEPVSNTYDITIAKIDAYTNKPLAGADLKLELVVNGVGEVKHSWKSTTDKEKISGLEPGLYRVTEVAAPSGYVVMQPVTFTIKDGENKSLDFTVKNTPTQVTIYKRDRTSSKNLVGARLQVLNASTKEVMKVGETTFDWTTTNEETILRGLPVGTYILHEVSAPEGYLVADDITFTVKDPKSDDVYMYDVPGRTTATTNNVQRTSSGGTTAAGQRVQTGDENNMILYVISALFFAIIASSVVIKIRKKK